MPLYNVMDVIMIKITMIFGIIIGLGLWSQVSHAKAEDCTECHEQLENPIKHGPASDGCTFCHNPDHTVNTGRPFRLIEEPNKLCLMCHDGIANEGHPVQGHPLSGPKDPIYPKRKFSCVSCHSPHSTKMQKLFRYDYSMKTPYKGALCAICHWSMFNNTPKPPAPPWSDYQK